MGFEVVEGVGESAGVEDCQEGHFSLQEMKVMLGLPPADGDSVSWRRRLG